MAVTHIAGLVLNVNGRVIQRCALCGEKLIDAVLANCMVPVEDKDRAFPTWEPFALLHVDGNYSSVLEPSEDRKLPADSCLSLIEL